MEQVNQQPVVQPESNEITTIKPDYPVWPTSKPGPRVTPTLPGMRSHPKRPEQEVEVGYDQVAGEPINAALDRGVPVEGNRSVAPDQEKSLKNADNRTRERHQKRPR